MKGKVTVIDDDNDLRSLLQIALRIDGYEVTGYANGAEFMDAVATTEPSALYIIDINLGGISGFELCDFLKSRKETSRSFVILISANPEVQQLARQAKADDHLLKPFSQKELLERIDKLFQSSQS